MTSMRRADVASTSIQGHFDVVCPLDETSTSKRHGVKLCETLGSSFKKGNWELETNENLQPLQRSTDKHPWPSQTI